MALSTCAALALALAFVSAPGCKSSNTTGTGGAGAAQPGVSCVAEGEVGNAVGVGKHCLTHADCAGLEADVCLAENGQDQTFCTLYDCLADAECGDGARCVAAPDGAICVPTQCIEGAGGGGAGGGGAGGGGAGGGGAGGVGGGGGGAGGTGGT